MSGIIKSTFESVKGNIAFPKSYPTSIAEVIASYDGSDHSDEWVKLDLSPTDSSEGKTVLVSLSYMKSADDYLDYWVEKDGEYTLKPNTTVTMVEKSAIQYGEA